MWKILMSFALLFTANAFAINRMENTFPDFRASKSNEMKVNMGLTAGVNAPRNSSTTTPEVGAIVGFQPLSAIGLQAELSTSRFQTSDDRNFERVTALGRATYNFGGGIPIIRDSYLGAGAGRVWTKNQSEWALAPLAGFDIPLKNIDHNVLSLGLSEKLLMVTNATNSWITAAALKYWF